jgi:ribosomal protein S27AE
MIAKKICPRCGSEDVVMASGDTGTYICRSCGYSGPITEKKDVNKRINAEEEK